MPAQLIDSMKSLREKLTHRKPVTVFVRDRGAVCFDFGVWAYPKTPSELLSGGLAWFWTSSRSGPNREESPIPGLPETRLLTRLNGENVQAFLDDSDDNRREIAIVGVDTTSAKILESGVDLANTLDRFAREGAGPIQALFSQEDDGDEVLFAAWPLAEPVRNLIASWIVQRDDIREFTVDRWRKWNGRYLDGLIAGIISRVRS
jgi:hypothetical protein